MAINIPIITTFSDSGLAAANKKIGMFGKQFGLLMLFYLWLLALGLKLKHNHAQ